MRLEQRIGRVDRIGQKQRVHAFHLISHATGELRILEYLRSKLTRVRDDIGTSDPLGWPGDDVHLAAAAAGVEPVNCAPLTASHDPPGDAEPGTFGHVEPGASAELKRLQTARRFSAGAPRASLPAHGDCFATKTHRTPTRAQLRGRMLAVVLAEVTDAAGRSIALRLVPLLLKARRFGRAGRVGQHLAAVAREIEASAAQIDDGGWQRKACNTHGALLAARRRRDKAILADIDRHPSSIVQAGLFDRRALRERAGDEARRLEMRNDLERSLASDATSTHGLPRVALMLADRW
jgi:hypothetical protein